MNKRHIKFVNEYLKDFNGSRAYRATYPSCKKNSTAEANASRLLGNAKVQELLAEKQKKNEEKAEITQERIMKELAKMGFGTEKFKVTNKFGIDVEVTPTIPERKAALELMGKQIGMFVDRVVNIEIEVETIDEIEKMVYGTKK